MPKIAKPEGEIIKRSFEDCIEIIDREISKRKYKWTLTALPYIDFDDVAQNLRKHIFLKWHLYDQSRPLVSWLNTVISNQMINMIRNVYGNFSRPCLKCEFNEGGDLCSKFGTQNTRCELFKTWVYGKKTAYDIKLPLAMENHQNEVYDIKSDHVNIDKTALNIHEKMKKVLKPIEWKVYNCLYIEHKSEAETALFLGYKSNESKREPGYKQIKNVVKSIIKKVRICMANDEIDIVY